MLLCEMVYLIQTQYKNKKESLNSKNMNYNQYLNLQKNNSINQGLSINIQAHAGMLFNNEWNWNPQLNNAVKNTRGQTPTPSLKQDILNWFQNLSSKDKIASMAIHNSHFIRNFLHLLPTRSPKKIFNLNTNRSIKMCCIKQEDEYFQVLLNQLRVAWLNEPVLYLSDSQVIDIRMLEWLNIVSSNKIFQNAQRGYEGVHNLLWFNCHSFHYLQNWLVCQFQMAIIKNYFHKKSPQYYLSDFQKFLKRNSKNAEAAGVQLTLSQVIGKSTIQLNNLQIKLKEEQEKFNEKRHQQIIQQIEIVQQPKKTKKRKQKRKNIQKRINQQTTKVNEQANQIVNVINQKNEQNIFLQEEKDGYDNKQDQTTQHEEKHKTKTIDNTGSPQLTVSPKQQKQITPKKDQELKSCKQRTQEIDKQKNMRGDSNKVVNISKNLIYVSPKRTRSPQQIRTRTMLEDDDIKQKYSEQDKDSINLHDGKSSQNQFSQQPNDSKDKIGKRRRRRCKKQADIAADSRKILWNKLVSRQLDNLVDELGQQTNSLYQYKIKAFERVRYFVQVIFATANAVLFGSNATGLSLPNSDVDILLVGLPCTNRDEVSDVLAHIAVQINAMDWIVSCSTYLRAKVPLLKLQIDVSIPFVQTKRKQDLFTVYNPAALSFLDINSPSNLQTISVDIIIDMNTQIPPSLTQNCTGPESTNVMKKWIDKIPNLQRIVILFKYVMYILKFNVNFNGGIGSYGLFVMMAAFMQTHPQLHDSDIASIFTKMLKWYGQDFDNLSKAIYLRQNGHCFVDQSQIEHEQEIFKTNLLKLVDPITGKVMNGSRELYNHIKSEFRRILTEINSLEDKIELQLKISQMSSTELGKMMQNRKSVQKWLNRFENKYGLQVKQIILDQFS